MFIGSNYHAIIITSPLEQKEILGFQTHQGIKSAVFVFSSLIFGSIWTVHHCHFAIGMPLSKSPRHLCNRSRHARAQNKLEKVIKLKHFLTPDGVRVKCKSSYHQEDIT